MLALIVAGGRGTRARALTGEGLPKALLSVGGEPILDRQMRALAAQGVGRVLILAGHLGSQLASYVTRRGAELGLAASVFVEPQPLGTAGAVVSARGHIDAENFLVVFGDLLFNVDLARLMAAHCSANAAASIVCRPNDHPARSDLVVADDADRIVQILPRNGRPAGDYRNLVPGGLYAVARCELDGFPAGENIDFMGGFFPRLLARGCPVNAYRSVEYMCDIGTPDGLAAAERDLASGRVQRCGPGNPRPAILFDCDGVLNEEVGGYGITAADQLRVLPGAARAVRDVNRAGLLALGVTNRPQLAKGLITRPVLEAVFARLDGGLAEEGGFLDRLYFCPHHPERGFPGELPELKVQCDCRKPAPGMLERAFAELPVERSASAMIGDSWRDVGAARAAGIYAYGVRTGCGCREMRDGLRPDLMFADVTQAVGFCLGYGNTAQPLLDTVAGLASPGRIALVGLCGHSQSGKSVLAHALERRLRARGLSVLRVRLDDWIVPIPERGTLDARARNRVAAYPAVYRALRKAEEVVAPGYDPATRGPAPAVRYRALPGGIVLVEGILACDGPGRSDLDLAVFVAGDEPLLRQRQAAVLRWKGLKEDDMANVLDARWGEEYSAVEPQRGSADAVIAPHGAGR